MIMKENLIVGLFLLAGIIISPVCASAQLPEALTIEFFFDGTGNAMINSLPVYAGAIYDGDPLVLGADWWIRIDDSTWPPPSDPQARWDYLFNNFAVYKPASRSWMIVFDEHSCGGNKPEWEINHATNGMMSGTLAVAVTYTDWNRNGILDINERMLAVYSGNMIVMKYGTGIFAGYCGEGTFNGSLNNPDPANWADDYVKGSCALELQDCSIGTRESSWTAIKSLFE
jgi:hypothetical protein